jgi:hypothetical protein
MKRQRLQKMASVVAVALALAGAGSIAMGATNALFNSTMSASADTFAAGTVQVEAGTPASVTCAVTTMMPGDSSTGFGSGSLGLAKCSYKVKYTGSAGAWLAVDAVVNGGTPNLFTSTSTGLQYKVSVNGGTDMISGTTFKTADGTNTSIASGTPVTNLLINSVQAATNSEYSIDVEYALPWLAPNSLQGGTSSIALTFHATQSANNPIGTCVANRQCSSITWS